MTILPRKNDVLFAHKALNLLPGLSVAGHKHFDLILFNRTECDVSFLPRIVRLQRQKTPKACLMPVSRS